LYQEFQMLRSEADKAIIQYLEEQSGKAKQSALINATRARWTEGYIYQRLRTLESRGQLERERDASGRVLIFLVKDSEVRGGGE